MQRRLHRSCYTLSGWCHSISLIGTGEAGLILCHSFFPFLCHKSDSAVHWLYKVRGEMSNSYGLFTHI